MEASGNCGLLKFSEHILRIIYSTVVSMILVLFLICNYFVHEIETMTPTRAILLTTVTIIYLLSAIMHLFKLREYYDFILESTSGKPHPHIAAFIIMGGAVLYLLKIIGEIEYIALISLYIITFLLIEITLLGRSDSLQNRNPDLSKLYNTYRYLREKWTIQSSVLVILSVIFTLSYPPHLNILILLPIMSVVVLTVVYHRCQQRARRKILEIFRDRHREFSAGDPKILQDMMRWGLEEGIIKL